ncbi:unnamed protein product [Rotaria sordida]|uniref:Uncharacterized protein n=1 Tax=Rotaria sordida TaxID=392033 RepID=A0A814BKA7_9BILA|nr:unnamed protein product [Rotaria sordida]
MVLNDDLVNHGMTIHHGKHFDFCLIDFPLVHSNAPLAVRSKCRDFRDNLIRTFSDDAPNCENTRRPCYKWTIEFIWSAIIDDVIVFNESFKAVSIVRPKRRTPDYSYPLRLHANSISSGLVFNYFYSYLNRQVGSTNNIFLTFIFDRNISREAFPSRVNTMKKTTKDCYDTYEAHFKSVNLEEDKKNAEIRLVPVYYLLAPTSCNFGPPDTGTSIVHNETTLRGTIIDPDNPKSIHLATINGEVLRSRPMHHYNRYLRRTFYYIDEIDKNNKLVRYLFCGEYPYILSILGQLEQSGQISRAQKRDEYLRFCNMLNRILAIENLTESIKLIQIDDEERKETTQLDQDDKYNQADYADAKSLSSLIKEDIDQWYDSSDMYVAELSITSMILQSQKNNHVVFFFFKKTNNEQLIIALIKDLKEKLEAHGYVVDDVIDDLNSIEELEQIIFICTGHMNDHDNYQMMQAVGRKITKRGVLRDVFIFINDAIQHFSCHLIKSVPYLTFDLRVRTAQLTDDEVREVIDYLNNMNILSETYTNMFDDAYHSVQQTAIQCTSVGAGCAAAFYFNYAKILTSSPAHQQRIKLIHQQLLIENLLDSEQNKAIFISKWVFVIPWTIENSSQLLSYGLSLNESEQKSIGFSLTCWKSANTNFISPNLSMTIGGVFQRSYSPLVIYKLTNLPHEKIIYFPMEIPAALHGLQNQYQNILSHFNFGTFNPLEQAMTFRRKVEEHKASEPDAKWHEDIILVPLDRPSIIPENKSITSFQQAEILLKTLWEHLSSASSN